MRAGSRSSLSTGAALAFTARGAGAALMLVAQVVIARELGVADAGRIATGLTALAIFAILGRYGLDQLIVRRVAIQDETSLVRAEYAAAARICLPALVVLGVLLLVVAPTLTDGLLEDPATATPLRWMAVALPAFGFVAVQGEALKALGAPFLGSLVQSVVGPVVSLALLLAPGLPSTPSFASAALVAGFVASSVVAHLAWLRLNAGTSVPAALSPGALARESWPFFGTSVLNLVLVYAPVAALVVAGGPDDVGRFFAADRWTQIPSMLLVAINATVGPRFAQHWVAHRRDEVRALLRSSTLASLLLAVGVGGGIVLGAPWLLALFGSEYRSAVTSLRLLGLAQIVVLGCGPVSSLLVMSGGERQQRRATALAATLVVVLSVLLVPVHGLLGAAIAASAALAASRITILVMATRTLAATARR